MSQRIFCSWPPLTLHQLEKHAGKNVIPFPQAFLFQGLCCPSFLPQPITLNEYLYSYLIGELFQAGGLLARVSWSWSWSVLNMWLIVNVLHWCQAEYFSNLFWNPLFSTQVYLRAPMILNGVCVIWRGWIDLHRLDGMGYLEYDEERAQVTWYICGYVRGCVLQIQLAFHISFGEIQNDSFNSQPPEMWEAG